MRMHHQDHLNSHPPGINGAIQDTRMPSRQGYCGRPLSGNTFAFPSTGLRMVSASRSWDHCLASLRLGRMGVGARHYHYRHRHPPPPIIKNGCTLPNIASRAIPHYRKLCARDWDAIPTRLPIASSAMDAYCFISLFKINRRGRPWWTWSLDAFTQSMRMGMGMDVQLLLVMGMGMGMRVLMRLLKSRM